MSAKLNLLSLFGAASFFCAEPLSVLSVSLWFSAEYVERVTAVKVFTSPTTGERGWPSIIWRANNVLKSIGPPFQIEASMSENSHTQFRLVKRHISVDAAGAVRRRATRVWHRACAAWAITFGDAAGKRHFADQRR